MDGRRGRLQQVLKLSPLQAGFGLAPQAFIAFMLFPLAATVINKIGVRSSLLIGLLIMAVGFALFGRISADGSYWSDVLPGLVVVATAFLAGSAALVVIRSIVERGTYRHTGRSSPSAAGSPGATVSAVPGHTSATSS